ncbi:MAG: hypothetical protein E6H96_07285, partial [Chloroflexi bacterium]
DFSWSATGHGTDELGGAASLANETVNGSYDVLMPATTLTIQTNAPAQVHAGDSVSIVVREKNTGEGTITNVHVDGTGACLSLWTASATKVGGAAFSGSLAHNEEVDFTCSFLAPASDFSWTADGKGTDALGHAVPATGEHQSGSVDVVSPSTALTLKSVSATKIHAGDSVTIVVTEKNTGDGTLSNVHVVAGGDCAAFTPANVASLAANASQDFTCTIHTSSSQTADLSWTADGKGTDSLGDPAPTAGEHQEGSITVINPATTLTVKTAPPAKVYPGGSITIVVTEKNTGDDTLANVHVIGTGSCAAWSPANVVSLAPNATADFTCTFNAPADDFSWSATALSKDSLGSDAPLTNEQVGGDIEVLNPATTLVLKSSTPADLSKVLQGSSVTLVVTETNTGDDTLTGVNVTGSNSCAAWAAVGSFGGTLAPLANQDFTCTFSVTTADVDWAATGHGTDSLENPAPATNETTGGHIHVVNPNIDVVKTAGASLGSQVADGAVYQTENGTTVVYKYVVTTQDPDGLTAVQVSDDTCSPVSAVTSGGHNIGDSNTNDSLEPGESWIFQCSKLLTIADDQNTTINGHPGVLNVVTASGQPQAGGRVSDTDNAKVELLVPGIQVVKTAGSAADGATYTTEAFPNNVTYHYTITNTGQLGLLNLVVTDDNGTASTADDFEVCTIGSLAVGASTTCSKTLTVSADRTNVATATGHTSQKPDVDVSDTDNAVVDIVGPGIQIIKTAGTAADGAEFVTQPGPVTFTYVITNTGEVTLLNVVVVDDNGTPADTSDDVTVGTIASLDVGESVTLTKTLDVTTNRTNVATATGHTEQQPTKDVTDSDDAVVRVPTLTIAKDFTGNSLPDLGGLPQAKIGDTLTYTLTYTLANGPVHNAVITDVLPVGLASGAPFDISNGGTYDAGTHTITWNLGTLESSGTVSYKITVAATAPAVLDQPFVNTATIKSDETPSNSDTAAVLVPAPPKEATPTPRITPPNTATVGDEPSSSNPDMSLLLVLVGIAGLVTLLGFLTPAPARARRRQRRR